MKKFSNHFLFAYAAVVILASSSCYEKFDPSSYAPPLNIGGFTSAREIASANLVGYWAFNGSLVDSVSNTTATNTGTTFSNGIKSQLKVHVNNNGADAWLGNYAITNPWNIWMNIGVTYDAPSSTFKVFVNGAKIATQTIANFGNLVFQNATKMVVGTVQFQTAPSLTSATGSQPWASYLNGQVDELRIYNRALTENELGSLVKLEGRGK